jgi:hypothetical protein
MVAQEACWVLCNAVARADASFLSAVLKADGNDLLKNMCTALKEMLIN